MEKVKIKNHFISDIYYYQEGPGVRKWQFTTEGVKLINVGNINKGKIDLTATKIFLSETEANGKYKHFLIDEGDLLIACSGIVVDNFHNKIAFIEKEHLPLCLNTSTMRFKQLPEGRGTLIYLKYFLQTRLFKDQLQKLITGSAQLNFGPSHIRKIEIPLPPLATQQKIAAILDKADELRHYNKKLIEKYDALTQSLFLDMFGDPVKNEKEWEKKKISSFISKIESGWSPVCENKSRDNEDEWAVLKLGSVSYGTYNPLENKRYELNFPVSKMDCEVKKGDLLFTRKNTYHMVGTTAYVYETEPKLILPDTVFRLVTISEKANSIFLFYLLNHWKFLKEVQSLASGTSGSMPNISKAKLLSKEAILPPIGLQNQFAERVQAIESQKQQVQGALEKSEELYQGLLQQAFKGELN
jgi:type I restriction enzyme S subunit